MVRSQTRRPSCVTEDGEPGWPTRAWGRLVPNAEDATHHVLVERNAEGQGDLLSDPGTAPGRIPPFMSTTAAIISGLGPLGPGFVGMFDEKSRRYFRWVRAR